MTHATQQTYTVRDAAQRLHVTEGRIRQILLAKQPGTIGRKHGTAWILTDDDVHRIGLATGKKSRTPLA